MKIKSCYILLLGVFLQVQTTIGQSKTIDSLKILVKNSRNDYTKTKDLNLLADQYKTIDAQKIILYANQALDLSKKTSSSLEEGNSYQNLGNANVILGNYIIALDYFTQGRILFENILKDQKSENSKEIKNGLAKIYGSLGYVFMEQSNYPKALEYNFKSLKIFQETKNLEKISRIYNNIGVIYKSQKYFDKAILYYEKSLRIQAKTPNELIGVYTNNLGLNYLEKKNFKKAFNYFTVSKNYFDQFPNSLGSAQLNYNLSNYHFELGNITEAENSALKALKLFTEIDNKFGIADANGFLAKIYSENRQFKKAAFYSKEAIILAKKLHVLDKIKEFEKTTSEIYEKQNNPKEALIHYKNYVIAKDSIENAETVKSTIRTEMNFDFERKEILQKEEQFKRELIFTEKAKFNQLILIFVIVSSIFAVGFTIVVYSRKQLKKTLTLEKELAIYEQKALHLQMNPHFIFNCLGSISSFIVKNSTDAAIKYLAKFSKLMRLTLEYSKEALIPIDKEIESLQNYLELEQLRYNHIFQFKINKATAIEDDLALPPLLIQPFVENAIIHGMNPLENTGVITINFGLEAQNLICVITDNGVGINKSKSSKKNLVSMHKSMALDITQKRLEMLTASTTKSSFVEIIELNDNEKIVGTQVKLTLPVQYL